MILTSKYPGRCITCGGAIAVGQQVEWIKGRKGVVCCLPEIKAMAKTVETSRQVDADIDVPRPEGLDYLGYQRAGVAYVLAAKEGTVIGDEMGLGKTIQAIGVINATPAIKRTLVICPKSLTLNWIRELRKWLVRPTAISRAGAEEGGNEVVIVASYEETKKYQASLSRLWDLVVVDEAHMIKSAKTQRTKTVFAVAALAGRRIALTGTPIVNRPAELFTLLALVAPQAWNPGGFNDKGHAKGFFKFGMRYCGGYKARFGWDFSGATNLPALQTELRATCMVRRLKADVLKDLPAKRRQIVLVSPEGDVGDVVRAEREAWDEQEDRLADLRTEAELARASDDPDAYEAAAERLQAAAKAAFTEISRLRHATAMAKVPTVIEHVRAALEDDEERKIVVFGHHHDVIDALMAGLAEFSPVELTGQTELVDRQAAVDRFQTDPRCRVFVGGIQAAGVGITLTASSHVVVAELPWTPSEMSQAEDRCHRIGQTQSVLVQHMVLDGSLDARMVEVLVDKQRIADAGLDKLAAKQVVIPSARAGTEGKRADLDALAARITPRHADQVHAALRQLAGVCNGAATEDAAGFSKIDVAIGHSLANAARLTPRQAALGLRLCRKYRRQLGEFGEMATAFMDLAKDLPANVS